jgi:hypothetical protein
MDQQPFTGTAQSSKPLTAIDAAKENIINRYANRVAFSIQQPSYVLPKMKENKANGGYLTYGDDNKYPDYLLNAFMGSSLHQAIILRKVDEIVANGLYVPITTIPSGNTAVTKNVAAINDFINSCNRSGNSLNEVFRKCCLDYEIYGGFTLQVIYTKGSTAKKPQIAEIRYIDLRKFRFTLDADKLRYAKDWSLQRVKTIDYDLYDEADPTGVKIFYYSGTLTREWYPVPQYIGSIPAIETSIEIANFNLNQIRNGFFPSIMVSFLNGEPTEEEKAFIEKKMTDKWGGSSQAGKAIFTFADNKDAAPKIDTIEQPDLDKRFINLQTSVRDEIFVGHRVTTPAIFGVQTAGKLGHGSEYLQGYSIFQNTYVKPQQRILLQLFNKLLGVNFKGCDLQILPIEPINTVFTDETLIASQMTSREIRELLYKWGYITQVAILNDEKVIGITNVKPAPNKTNDEAEPANNVPPPGEKNIGDSTDPS